MKTLRNIDTMDAKDWIILRLLRLCAINQQARVSSDFSRTTVWVANNIDIFSHEHTPRDVALALHNDVKRQEQADRYIYAQWPQPDHIDALVPFEALLVSVQSNDS